MPKWLPEEPKTPIEHLAKRVRQYINLTDMASFYIVMGAAAANMMYGEPIYLMLVGAPSSGKTILIESLLGVEHVHEVGMVDGRSAFLSGTGKKDRMRGATGGALMAIQPGEEFKHGAIVIPDFTSILKLDTKNMLDVMDVFRQAYGGSIKRPVGSDGGKVIEWKGRLGVFSAVTNEIDQIMSVGQALGERWLYFRFKAGLGEKSRYANTKVALEEMHIPGWKEELEGIIAGFFSSMELQFGSPTPRRPMQPRESQRIFNLASVLVRCRSSLARDWRNRDQEVVGLPETEFETRVSKQLAQLLVGLEEIGVGEKERWELIARVALDSMPLIKREILKIVVRGEKPPAKNVLPGVRMSGDNGLESQLKIGKRVVGRAVEDMIRHEVLEKESRAEGKTHRDYLRLSGWMREHWPSAIRGMGLKGEGWV